MSQILYVAVGVHPRDLAALRRREGLMSIEHGSGHWTIIAHQGSPAAEWIWRMVEKNSTGAARKHKKIRQST